MHPAYMINAVDLHGLESLRQQQVHGIAEREIRRVYGNKVGRLVIERYGASRLLEKIIQRLMTVGVLQVQIKEHIRIGH